MKVLTLKKNYDFQRVYRKGKSYVTPCFVLYIRKNNKHANRLGFTVSKKIGNAVKRNRARRRLKEVFKKTFNPELRGYDIIVVARSRARTEKFSVMTQMMADLFKQLDQK